MRPSAYGVARLVLRPPLRRGLEWRVEDLERIPRQGAAILAANHISLLDPLAVGYLADRRGREPRFLAMAELFRLPGLRFLLRHMGQIPVERATPRAAASLAPAQAALASGDLVVIFPEGGLSPDLEPGTGRTGVARLARAAAAPVVPVGMWGTHRIHAEGHIPRWRPGLVVAAAFGGPLLVMADESDREATDRIMAAVATQVVRARQVYGQQAPAGEEAWWRAHHRRFTSGCCG